MIDPPRWRDGTPDAPSRASELLAAGAAPRAMTAAERARATHAATRLASGGTVVAAAQWAGIKASLAGIGLLGALSVGVAVVRSKPHASTSPLPTTTASASRELSPPALAHTVETPRSTVTAVPRAIAPLPQELPAPTADRAREHARPTAPLRQIVPVGPSIPVAPAEDPLAREAAILARALAHLESDANESLAVLAQHASQFPSGQLSSERECIAVSALDRLGRAADANARAQAAIDHFPGSPCARRMRGRLGTPSPHAPQE